MFCYLKGAVLFCESDPIEAGVADKDGLIDPKKLREHIKECPECNRFEEMCPESVLDNLDQSPTPACSGCM